MTSYPVLTRRQHFIRRNVTQDIHFKCWQVWKAFIKPAVGPVFVQHTLAFIFKTVLSVMHTPSLTQDISGRHLVTMTKLAENQVTGLGSDWWGCQNSYDTNALSHTNSVCLKQQKQWPLCVSWWEFCLAELRRFGQHLGFHTGQCYQ